MENTFDIHLQFYLKKRVLSAGSVAWLLSFGLAQICIIFKVEILVLNV